MLEAAISLMRGSGLSGAGINEIVRESGAPKGSVYYFFPDGKLALVSEHVWSPTFGNRQLTAVNTAQWSRA